MNNISSNAYFRHKKFVEGLNRDALKKEHGYEERLARLRVAKAVEAVTPAGSGRTLRLSSLVYKLKKMVGHAGTGKRPAAEMPDDVLLAESGLFDEAWYLGAYPDVAASGTASLSHFLNFGYREERDPGPHFSTAMYNEMYPDVLAAGLNPVLHYLRAGAYEGRTKQPSRLHVHGVVDNFLRKNVELKRASPRVVYISGEPGTPGEIYRVDRYAEAWSAIGATVDIVKLGELNAFIQNPGEIDILILWRVAMVPELAKLVGRLKEGGVPVVFDVDDLMIEPALVRPEIIDGLRSQNIPVSAARSHFERVRQTFQLADIGTASTDELLWFMRARGADAFVLRNGIDDGVYRISRRAVARRRLNGEDGLFRIGYPGGTKTHQRDFSVCVKAVARFLSEHNDARLVLFKDPDQKTGLIDTTEFPELNYVLGQIEWRNKVGLSDLPHEIARFDVCVAPLERENVYCEAKSELKYFESAICDVCLIASPVGPFKHAIADGKNGFHASDDEDWYDRLCLVFKDASLRNRVVSRAHRDALARYGIEARIAGVRLLRDRLLGNPGDQAGSFLRYMADLKRGPVEQTEISDFHVVKEIVSPDTMPIASIVIPLFNYEKYIVEAMDSVAQQNVKQVELIIVDDCSTDSSLATAMKWLEQNGNKLPNVSILQTARNGGLANARNVGFMKARAPYVLPLDADNILGADCVGRLVAFADEHKEASFVYSTIEKFQGGKGTLSDAPFSCTRLLGGNYIDAMALVRKGWWARVGGYDHIQHGWEDYDFWLKIIQSGGFGVHLNEVHSRYRVHGSSMLQADTNQKAKKKRVVETLSDRYPWLSLVEARDWFRHL